MGDSHVDANDYSRFDEISDSDNEDVSPGSSVTVAERISQIGTAKVAGNEFIAKTEYKQAASQYRKGIKVLDDLAKSNSAPNPAENLELKELELSLHLNLAMAELKLGGWAAARKAADRALTLEPANFKGLFRRGQAYAKAGDLEAAKRDLAKLVELDPANGSAKKELAGVKRKLAEAKAAAKKGFGGLFERAGGMYDDREGERAAKEAAKRQAEAEKRAAWEAEMAKKEAEAAAEHAMSGDGGAVPVFERTPFDEWSKAQDKKKEEEAKAAEEAKERAREEARRKRLKEQTKQPEDDEEELDEEDAALLADIKKKGYCHFRRQQSDEEKALIGDIAPKKIDSSDGECSIDTAVAWASGRNAGGDGVPPPTSGGTAAGSAASAALAARATGVGSAWNQGNTWEEADASAWAKESLQRHLALGQAEVGGGGAGGNAAAAAAPAVARDTMAGLMDAMELTGGGEGDGHSSRGSADGVAALVTARVKKVASVDGDASVAVVRGTKRYLFDLSAELEYEVVVDEAAATQAVGSEPGNEQGANTPSRPATYRGKIKISDLTHDGDAPEMNVTPSAKRGTPAPHHRTQVEAAMEGLKRDLTARCVSNFVAEFHSSQ